MAEMDKMNEDAGSQEGVDLPEQIINKLREAEVHLSQGDRVGSMAESKRFAKLLSIVGVIKTWTLWRKVATATITIALVAVVAGLAATLIPSGGGSIMPHMFGSVIPTNKWANFYSTESMLDGQPLPAGTVITAYDPQGVVCGEFLITEAGRFGLMSVYADDELTEDDEGAVEGDLLEFRINGILATAVGPDEPQWIVMGDLRQVDLTAFTP